MPIPTPMNDWRNRLAASGRRIRGWFRQPLTVRVSPQGIFLEQAGKSWRGRAATNRVALSVEDAGALGVELSELLATEGISPGRVKLVLSDHWLRPLVLELPSAGLSDAEIEVLVSYRYRQTYGGQMQDWAWRWVRQQGGPLVAMAWPESLLAGLRDAIGNWGGTLASAVPESLDAMQRADPGSADAWMLVAEARHATIIRVGVGVWRQWRGHILGPASATVAGSVGELLQRAVARSGDNCRDLVIIEAGACGAWPTEMAQGLAVAGWKTRQTASDAATGSPVPRMDFAHGSGHATQVRHRVFALVALVLGIELGGLGWALQTMEAERAQLEDSRGRLLKHLRPASEPVLSKEMTARADAVRSTVARLSIPWESLLAALESVRGDKVVVESLRPDLATHKVDITATAPTFGDIAEFIDRVNASKVLQQAYLVSETTGREPGIRFVVTATWSKAK
jgi:hypothetical protein